MAANGSVGGVVGVFGVVAVRQNGYLQHRDALLDGPATAVPCTAFRVAVADVVAWETVSSPLHSDVFLQAQPVSLVVASGLVCCCLAD